MESVKIFDTEIPNNVKVYWLDLPDGVHGVIAKLDAERFLIVINAGDSDEEQRKTLKHELWHYYNGDLEGTGKDINEIEFTAHLQEGRL